MGHPFNTYVLGGVGVPRFFPMKINYVTNKYFNSNTTGWTAGANTILAVSAQNDAFGLNMMKVSLSATPNISKVYWEASVGENLFGKIFIAKFRIKGNAERMAKVSLRNSLLGELDSKDFYLTKNVQEIIFITEVLQSTTAHDARLQIDGSKSSIAQNDFYIDHIWFAEATDDFYFPSPQRDSLEFKKISYGDGRLWSGESIDFARRWMPVYNGQWTFLNATYEEWRQQLSQSQFVFCVPHLDVEWGFVGTINDNHTRAYNFDRYLGHDAKMKIDGAEYIIELPNEQGGGAAYMESTPPDVLIS